MKRVIRCRTAEQGGKHDFKQAILDVCNHRNDAQARDVRIRIQGAISYLHAADAIYHKECYALFIASRSISAAVNKSSCSSNESGVSDPAFQMVVDAISGNPSHIWNSVDVHNLYLSHKGSCLSRRLLTTKLTQQFSNDLLVLSGSGVANLLVFRSKASSVLRLVDDDEDNVSASVEIMAKQIIRECRELKHGERYYQTRLNLDEAKESCSPTLLSRPNLVSTSLHASMSAALIGNIVTNSITHQATILHWDSY